MKLSIIVPVYNLENYIATTLESLLSIHFSSDYEIVVINDGSMDRSESIIRDYQQKHSQIVLYTIENQGVSNARNLGIARARGMYITFLDGDDTVEPDFFEKAVQELDRGEYDFVQGNYTIIDCNRKLHSQYVDKDMEICDNKYMMELFFAPDKKIHNSVWGKVFCAETIRGVVFDKTLSIAEDQKFIFDILCISKKIKLLKDESVKYYFRDSSAIHSMNEKKIAGQLAVLAYCKKHVSYPEIKAFIQRHELLVLLNMYAMITMNGGDNGECYKRLCELDVNPIRDSLNYYTRFKVFLIKHARFIYDLILRKRYRNSNGK